VVDAALAVVDRVGVDGLTIRAVATAAGAPTMSLYSHFANKEELLDLMYAEVAFRLYADAEHTTWQDALAGLCHQVRQVLLAHPHWVPLLSRPALPSAVPLRERALRLMTAAGMPPEEALASLTNAALISLGLTMVELSFRDAGGASRLAKRFEHLRESAERSSSMAEHPVTRAAFARMPHFDLSRAFEAAVKTFVMGLEAKFPPK
jgi:TetR/AcrR family transcriptional regulator, tetracycline repressor protein